MGPAKGPGPARPTPTSKGVKPVFLEIILPVLGLAATYLGNRFIRSTDDRRRADLLTRIAESAAALYLMRNPDARVETVVAYVIAALRSAGVTKNAAAIERVAALASQHAVTELERREAMQVFKSSPLLTPKGGL